MSTANGPSIASAASIRASALVVGAAFSGVGEDKVQLPPPRRRRIAARLLPRSVVPFVVKGCPAEVTPWKRSDRMVRPRAGWPT